MERPVQVQDPAPDTDAGTEPAPEVPTSPAGVKKAGRSPAFWVVGLLLAAGVVTVGVLLAATLVWYALGGA